MRTRVRSVLGNFLFSGDTIEKKVKVLSGGERARLSLARMLMSPANLLVLDEPTNHLDMASKDILKNALLQYGGTLIIVSHDRDFLQGLTSKVFEFRNQGIREHLGDIYEFLEKRKLENIDVLNQAVKAASAGSAGPAGNRSKLDYERRKQFDRDTRKVKNQIVALENEIGKTENRIAELDGWMAIPEHHQDKITNGDVFREYEQLRKSLDQMVHDWEQLHLALEEIEKAFGLGEDKT
jgi:ATP-binding cassette subfamily F protein 3